MIPEESEWGFPLSCSVSGIAGIWDSGIPFSDLDSLMSFCLTLQMVQSFYVLMKLIAFSPFQNKYGIGLSGDPISQSLEVAREFLKHHLSDRFSLGCFEHWKIDFEHL